MRDYNHWSILGLLNELLPHPDNRVTLSDQVDQFGMPIPHFAYSLSDNDKAQHRLRDQDDRGDLGGRRRPGSAEDRPLRPSGRGSADGLHPEDSVVDSDHRVWGMPNLFVVDGSVLPTQGAANPALVIMALADRCAELLKNKRLAGTTTR